MQSSGPFCGILIQSLQNKILGEAKECIAFMCSISWLIHYIKKSSDGVNEPYSPGHAAEYLLKAYKDTFADCTLSRFVEQESGLSASNHYVLRIRK